MTDKMGSAAQLLRPILDTYRGSAVGVAGCHSQGLQRPSCELDVIVVSNDMHPQSTVRVGGVFVDLVFVSEKDVLKPPNPEHAVSMALATIVRDTSLILSTSSASNTAVLADSARRSSRQRLASALKGLGRVDEAVSGGSLADADYWLVSAAYDYAYALLYFKEVLPAPSHLLRQLKDQAKGAFSFEAFTKGAGLERSSRASCASRLEGISVLFDVLSGGERGARPERSDWSRTRLKGIEAKARELNDRIEHTECYSYLGQEVTHALAALAAIGDAGSKGRGGPGALTSGVGRMLSERLILELGLGRDRDSVVRSLELVREHVSGLAKKA